MTSLHTFLSRCRLCLRLYRPDVAVISFLAFQAGVLLAGSTVSFSSLGLGLIISLIPMNFVYSVNAYADRALDAINKPCRPLPSKRLHPTIARRYCIGLAALGLLLPLLVSTQWVMRAGFAALIVLGWVYSCPPLRLRRWPIPALLVIAAIHHLPALLGAWWGSGTTRPLPHILWFTFVFALALIPLKDIEDARGDAMCGVGNWAALLGIPRLMMASAAVLIINMAVLMLIPLPRWPQTCLIALHALALLLVAAAGRAWLPRVWLYRTLLWLLAAALAWFDTTQHLFLVRDR